MYNRQQIRYRMHTRNNLDNLKNRIIVDFCNYIILLLNLYTKIFFNFQRVKFRKIENQFKKKTDENSIINLMNMTLEDFCKINISLKYKNFDKKQNIKSFQIFKKITNNTLINFRLKDLFEKFYLKDEKIKIMNNTGKYVLIDDLKSFQNLKKNENEEYIKRLNKASLKLIEVIKKQNSINDFHNLTIEENDVILFPFEDNEYDDF